MKRPIVVLLGLLAATPAAAAERKVLVFPLTGAVPNDPGDTLARLTTVVGRAAGLTGSAVVMAQISFDDAATLAGCSASEPDCAGTTARSLGADDAVFGIVTPAADGQSVDVALTAFVDGATTQKTFTLSGEPRLMVQRLARDVPVLFVGGEIPPPEPQPEPTPVPEPKPTPVARPEPAPAPVDTGFHAGRVGIGAWVLTGSGLLMAGSGVVLMVVARDRQDQVDNAPVDTVQDLERLRDLEAEGRRLTIISDTLLVAGGVALVAGTILVVTQGRRPAASKRVSFAPLPLRGGAGLAVEVSLP
jgi:hypothetical protein